MAEGALSCDSMRSYQSRNNNANNGRIYFSQMRSIHLTLSLVLGQFVTCS